MTAAYNAIIAKYIPDQTFEELDKALRARQIDSTGAAMVINAVLQARICERLDLVIAQLERLPKTPPSIIT